MCIRADTTALRSGLNKSLAKQSASQCSVDQTAWLLSCVLPARGIWLAVDISDACELGSPSCGNSAVRARGSAIIKFVLALLPEHHAKAITITSSIHNLTIAVSNTHWPPSARHYY